MDNDCIEIDNDCIICADKLKKPVTCEYCKQTACIDCWRTFFKVVPSRNPKCIFDNCKLEWNSILMYKHLGINFMKKEYKEIKKKILFQHQESLIPDTLRYVSNYKRNKTINENIKSLELKLKHTMNNLESKRIEYINLNQMIKQGQTEFLDSSFQKSSEISTIDKQVSIIKNEIKDLKSKKTPLLLDVSLDDNQESKSGYKFHCPFSGCNGYIYENKGDTCIICNNTVCKKCETLIKKNENHICDSNVLANVLLLKNDTKGCPKCNTLIYKISGCDQMYCTKCKCCFSWNTGEIDATSIHNPHYFNELRLNRNENENNRIIGIIDDDIPCQQRMIDTFSTLQIIKKIQDFGFDKFTVSFLFSLIQKMNELKNKIVNLEHDDIESRLSFICNYITKEEFCKKIYLKDIDLVKKNEFNYLYDLYLTISDDYIKRLLLKQIKEKEFKVAINNNQDMINKNIHELTSIFGIKSFRV